MKGTVLTYGYSENDFLSHWTKNKNLEKSSFFDYYISRDLNKKFQDDKVFYGDEDVFISLDGAILNLKNLKNKYSAKSNFDLLKKMYQLHGERFINNLRGDVSIFLFDINKKTLLAYTNTTTTKPLYYYFCNNENKIAISSNPLLLVNTLKSYNTRLTPNIDAFKSVINYTYIFGESNYANEIKKLKAGHFIIHKENEFGIECYHKFQNFPEIQLSEDKIISQINELFTEAIKLQYEKDIEYGYNHLSNLSGGLDSRMTTLVGAKLGYKPDTLTFSSKGFYEEIIARTIVKKYNLNNSLLNVDDGEHLKELDSLLSIDGGVVPFHIAAQMLTLYGMVDMNKYGLVHSGQFGDAVVGNLLHPSTYHYKYAPIYPRYNIENYREIEYIVHRQLDVNQTYELTMFHNHVFNGTSKGNWLINEITESASPFTYQEFMEFCLKIPMNMRYQHNIYYKWIEKYYPDFGTFYYEKTKRRSLRYSKNIYINKMNHILNLTNLKLKGLKTENKRVLNFDIWWGINQLGEHFDTIFYSNIDLVKENELREQLNLYYNSKSVNIKLSVINCIMVYVKYFIE